MTTATEFSPVKGPRQRTELGGAPVEGSPQEQTELGSTTSYEVALGPVEKCKPTGRRDSISLSSRLEKAGGMQKGTAEEIELGYKLKEEESITYTVAGTSKYPFWQ